MCPPPAIPAPAVLDETNNKLTVSLNSKGYTVQLPTGSTQTQTGNTFPDFREDRIP